MLGLRIPRKSRKKDINGRSEGNTDYSGGVLLTAAPP